MMIRTRSWLIVSFAVGSFVLRPAMATAFCEEATAFCIDNDGVCETYGTPRCHAEVTEEGLSFMRRYLLQRTVHTNLHMDHEHIDTLWSHMDGCDWESGANNINGIYSSDVDSNFFAGVCVPTHCTLPHWDTWGVTGLLDPADPRPTDAAAVLGYALHPIQDFYSHSNWVEIFAGWANSNFPPGTDLSDSQPWNPYNDAPPPLMDETVDVFHVRRWEPLPVDPAFIAARHAHPTPTYVALAEEDGFGDDWHTSSVESVPYNVPYVLTPDDGPRYVAVISGSTHGSAFQEEECPAELTQSHTALNKDSTRMTVHYHGAGPDHHYAAADFAARQTAHEWCRILHLAKRVWGFGGVSVAMGYWVDPHAASSGPGSPHPPGTPCQAGAPGSVELSVDVDQIEVIDDHDADDDPGDLNFALVLYTKDLTRSARAEVNSLTISSGEAIGDAASPGPVSLCLTAEQAGAAVVTVQAWDDDGGPDGELNPDGDEAALGVTADAVLGVQTAGSPDMQVTFDVTNTPRDADGDGLSTCREAELGTGVEDPDSDDDGLSDGDEVDVQGTDPLAPDSDGDGIGDGEEVANGSDPLDADSDDDGLSDGDEVGVYGTDPADADSDDDGLNDGTEVELGTDPTDDDSDDDGLLDGRDVEFVQLAIGALPASAFKNQSARVSLLDRLNEIETLLLAGELNAAKSAILALRKKVDGCGVKADIDDAVRSCPEQLEIRTLFDLLLLNA